ncbi:hypothetical protein FAEPRAM212_00739 [Faecalibacterium prausnitzii M21/2]|uniref:Uncharacterized protein n=1 Tax=Faecalibacterium prausnitzii M21/2 TaxID=411485 RepID=A8S8F1_9FIRM|nr:hypothetical protein FAEPRAM212_00739 [Faecalibacterium prausnitzii M21/2]
MNLSRVAGKAKRPACGSAACGVHNTRAAAVKTDQRPAQR